MIADMTWIVGMPTMWGYSFAVSDVRVTLADGSERDCLQKIYPVARSIALGFAGSVRIGFKMVEVMKEWLHNDDLGRAWIPLETIELWPDLARDIFAAAPPQEQAGQCHLIMLSADPQATTGLGPVSYVHILRSPDFKPIQVATNKVAGIGSGNFIDQYKKSLDELSENHEQNFSLMQMETNNPGGMGTNLGFRITLLIKETNPTGISSHLHYCWVYLGKTIVKTNNHFTVGAWTGFDSGSGINQPEGSPKPSSFDKSEGIPGGTYFEMPNKIAQSWGELSQVLQSTGAQAEGTIA
jgi:hypothetical protein